MMYTNMRIMYTHTRILHVHTYANSNDMYTCVATVVLTGNIILIYTVLRATAPV